MLSLLGPNSLRYVCYEPRANLHTIFKTGVVYLYIGCLRKSGRDHVVFVSGLEKVQKTSRNRTVYKYKLQRREIYPNSILVTLFIICKRKPCNTSLKIDTQLNRHKFQNCYPECKCLCNCSQNYIEAKSDLFYH